jgi:chemotaxis protein CheD
MNHYMLPGDTGGLSKSCEDSARYGTHAMRLLIEHVVMLGAVYANLEAKVFGAGKVMNGMSDVGKQNADFALSYLEEHTIRVVAVDVGDILPRKIYFSPATGQVFVKRLRSRKLPAELFQSLLESDVTQK